MLTEPEICSRFMTRSHAHRPLATRPPNSKDTVAIPWRGQAAYMHMGMLQLHVRDHSKATGRRKSAVLGSLN